MTPQQSAGEPGALAPRVEARRPPRSRLHRTWLRGVRAARHRLLCLPAVGALVRRSGRRLLFCVGDSHSRVFDALSVDGGLRHTVVDVHWVLGATALGLANPNSRTHALEQFRSALRHVPAEETLVVVLGEVDCGFLVWHRAQQRGTAVRDEAATSLARFTEFLESLLAEGRTSLVVALVPPPTVPDYRQWAGLDNARRHVTASLEERTALTREYNDRLRAWAAAHDVRVLDYEQDLLDPRTGLVDERFRNPDPLSHHLERAAFARVVAGRLRGLGFS